MSDKKDLDLDAIALANAKAKGKRPWYFEDPATERVLCITMAVAGELGVCRERLDTLERLLEAKGVLSREEIENYAPDRDTEQQRAAAQREYIARIMRIVHQEMQDLEDPADLQSIAKELSRE